MFSLFFYVYYNNIYNYLENNNQQSQMTTKPQPDKTIKVVHFGIVWSFFIKIIYI